MKAQVENIKAKLDFYADLYQTDKQDYVFNQYLKYIKMYESSVLCEKYKHLKNRHGVNYFGMSVDTKFIYERIKL